MISLVFTNSYIQASMHSKNSGKMLFKVPINLKESGYRGAAAKVKQELKKCKISAKRVNVTLMEDVIYKEFSHLPVAEKSIASFAKLEARTVLRDQFDDFSISYLPYGQYVNAAGEHVCLLLATPINILKSIVTGFASEGLAVVSLHSGFDAYAAVTSAALPAIMGNKTYASIDFGYEYTLINIYAKGLLASQRRLPGLSASVLPALMQDMGVSEEAANEMIASGNYPEEFAQQAVSLETSFIWDILRTVRVVCAPIHLDPESFFISGEACKSQQFRTMATDNLALPCTFVDDLPKLGKLSFKPPFTSSLVNIGGFTSKLDLLGTIRQEKKNSSLNIFVCAIITLVMVAGLCAQPFAIHIKTKMLADANTRLAALMPVSTALDEVAKAQMKMTDIDSKLALLKTFCSNTGITLPDVLSLFTGGLNIKSVDYSGEDGAYNVKFTTADKAEFLRLKEKIFENESYYLNLSLSSNLDELGNYECTLSFTPRSYIPIPKQEDMPVAEEEPVEDSAQNMLDSIKGGA